MRIGYACLTLDVPGTRLRSCIKKNATPGRLAELIAQNLAALEAILDYNIAHNIRLFRISSDIIPFGSHPVNTLGWQGMFAARLAAIGEKALAHGMRLSMHPGQYTVLNSPNPEVVARAVADLRYHCDFLDSLGLGGEHKLILHIGGAYGDKAAAAARFAESYRSLDSAIKRRLVIENDDRLYNIRDVLAIGTAEGIPVVFDNLHHRVNPPTVAPPQVNPPTAAPPQGNLSQASAPAGDDCAEARWIAACAPTWRRSDGPQKQHYSQQAPGPGRKPGAHSETIDIPQFLAFCRRLPPGERDIMLEVKDKNLSALKCLAALNSHT